MERRALGRSALEVSVVGLGCNNFGWLIDEPASRQVIDRALDLGVNFFDTADVYGDSELVLGRALAGRRASVIIATKFGIARQGASGGASRRYILQAVERSLDRLQTDYIDLYYLHRPDPAVPVEETLRALEELIQQGKIRQAAASNMTPELLREAASMAASAGLHGFVATQAPYSLLARGIEARLSPVIQQLGLALIPYFPLASGMLTGKYRRGEAPPPGTRLSSWKQLASILTVDNFDRVERLQAFAGERGRSLVELAIAWLLHRPAVASVIAGATSASQIESNVRAADWHLTAEEIAQIERLSPAAPAAPA
ncbi:MAG TPA: aldo/keto reductase [Steroidobacteraceae bacterium]|nr:aldo/keto reductase [Steroidobacteraceae bacterium]